LGLSEKSKLLKQHTTHQMLAVDNIIPGNPFCKIFHHQRRETSRWSALGMQHLVAEKPTARHLRRLALWATEVGEPSTTVEFTVGGLDLVWAGSGRVGRWLDDESIETLDLLGGLLGHPSNDDGVACVPGVKDGEWDVWLRALTSEESGLGREGQASERKRSVCATVDQGVDRVSLVGIVGSEDSLRERRRVVGDQLGKVVGDDIGVRVAQAESIAGLGPAVRSDSGAGEHGHSPGEDGGGAHIAGGGVCCLGGDRWIDW